MQISIGTIRQALRIGRLRARINSYSCQLHSIHAQRANDFQLEHLIHLEMSVAKSDLKQLELAASSDQPRPRSIPRKRPGIGAIRS